MTTNAMCLADNMDFLAENGFNVLVSLDGGKPNNAYRIDAKGEESFENVMRNLKIVKDKHPKWFQTIRFNCVYTDISDFRKIVTFFRREFGKIPTFSPLHWTEDDAKGSEIIKSMTQKFGIPEDMELDDDLISQNPKIKQVYDFILQTSANYFVTEVDMLKGKGDAPRLATGTCIPFSKRMFVDHNGGLHPCEKVCRDYPLGMITDAVEIDYDAIATQFNNMLSKVSRQCAQCYLQQVCTRCLKEKTENVCSEFCNIDQFRNLLSNVIDYLERHPDIINQIENHLAIR